MREREATLVAVTPIPLEAVARCGARIVETFVKLVQTHGLPPQQAIENARRPLARFVQAKFDSDMDEEFKKAEKVLREVLQEKLKKNLKNISGTSRDARGNFCI